MSAQLSRLYLQAMGLPLYVPRFVLPGAAPSSQGDFAALDEPPLPAEQQQAAVVAVPATAQPVAVDSQAARRSLGELEAVDSRGREPVSAAPAASAAQGVRFRANLIDTGIGLRLLTDCSEVELRPAEKRLLANISRAVARRWQCDAELALSAERFDWPLVKVPGLLQGADEAREALSARLLARAGERPLRAVLVFGEGMRSYVCREYLGAAGVELIHAPAAQALLDDGRLKAPLWSALRAITA